MEERLNQIKNDYLEKVGSADSLDQLDQYFLELFGKNGAITLLPKDFPTLPKEELKIIGSLFNQVKQELEKEINKKRKILREEVYTKLLKEEWHPNEQTEIKNRQGRLHPISEFEEKIATLFSQLGFEQYDAPQIDTDKNNFELLNIPPEHPARDLWDTLYLNSKNQTGEKLLLRTHTSNAQIHSMKEYGAPLKLMSIGRCFRYENLDARHEHTFDQFELIYVDKNLSMANLQYLSEYLLKKIYGDEIKVRLSPGYYPFTEPSAHIFGTCVFCHGSGCKICSQTGELELAGAGMIHPNVLKNCDIDPEVYSGIAWGVGPGRMAMLKYDVNDLRLFNSADLNFLKGLRDESK